LLLMLLVGAEMFAVPLAAETRSTDASSSGISNNQAQSSKAENSAKKAAPAGAATKQAAGSTTAGAKSKVTSRTEAEISALTSETSDQLYGRVNVSRMTGRSGWWIRAGYGLTKTRTYSAKKVNETEVGTFSLDSQYRRDGGHKYTFISAVATIRNRSPYSSVYGDKTGYYMLSAGIGKTVMPGLEGELALAKITRYEDETDHRITPVYSLRLKTDLTDSMILDGDTHLVQPFTEDTLVDTRVNLTYKFTPSLSIRLTYVANNMLSPVQERTGWDRSFRISLVFGSTRN